MVGGGLLEEEDAADVLPGALTGLSVSVRAVKVWREGPNWVGSVGGGSGEQLLELTCLSASPLCFSATLNHLKTGLNASS